MIEKLNEYKITSRDGAFINVECNAKIINTLVRKINELVDTVNELQKHEEQHLDLLTELNEMRLHQNEEPTDPYAEQRKWIGKLCWVWDDNDDERAFSKLTEIIEDDDDRPFKCFTRWKHCEPVKPEDDIIYKGGDNDR